MHSPIIQPGNDDPLVQPGNGARSRLRYRAILADQKPTGIEFGGLGDEAGIRLIDQISAHLVLGWQEIELRTVDGIALADIDDASFRTLRLRLEDAGLRVTAISSRIGNWERPITNPFYQDTEELLRLAERMHELGSRYLRIMSYPNDGYSEVTWRAEALERISTLAEIAASQSIILVHENCSGWASESATRTLDMLRSIDSPALKLLFDIGNPVAYGYDGLAFLRRVLPWVVHVHVKDGITSPGGQVVSTYPGEGQAQVIPCLQLLLENGYRGIWSIEPHLHLIPHLRKVGEQAQLWNSYVDYGRRFMTLVEAHITQER
jgi:sugar phosphate isomerase/epimerase